MARLMFPFLWSDGSWRAEREPREQPTAVQPKPKKQWQPQGFFKHRKQMSRHDVALKASNARMWLEYTLHASPLPAVEVYRLAELEGLTPRGLRRASHSPSPR